jgi:hypothetical protein
MHLDLIMLCLWDKQLPVTGRQSQSTSESTTSSDRVRAKATSPDSSEALTTELASREETKFTVLFGKHLANSCLRQFSSFSEGIEWEHDLCCHFVN